MHTNEIALSDFQQIAEEIGTLIQSAYPTAKPKEDLALAALEMVPRWKIGPLDLVLDELAASLYSFYSTLTVPNNFEVQVAILEDHLVDGFIEVMFRLQMQGAGSISVPHALIKRTSDTYELLLPAEE